MLSPLCLLFVLYRRRMCTLWSASFVNFFCDPMDGIMIFYKNWRNNFLKSAKNLYSLFLYSSGEIKHLFMHDCKSILSTGLGFQIFHFDFLFADWGRLKPISASISSQTNRIDTYWYLVIPSDAWWNPYFSWLIKLATGCPCQFRLLAVNVERGKAKTV